MRSALYALPNNGMAPSNDVIAKHLREHADWLEAEDATPIRNVIIIMESIDGKLTRNICGQPCDYARVTGLLAVAQRME